MFVIDCTHKWLTDSILFLLFTVSLELFVCVSLVRFLHSEKSFAETSLDFHSQGGVGLPLGRGQKGETVISVF